MRLRDLRLIAAATLVLLLTACSAAAELRDGPPPTPQAAPAPQVVVIQTPAPARDDTALIFMLLIGLLTGGMTALIVGLIVGHQRGRASLTYLDAMAVLQDAQLCVLTQDQYAALLRDAQRHAIGVRHER